MLVFYLILIQYPCMYTINFVFHEHCSCWNNLVSDYKLLRVVGNHFLQTPALKIETAPDSLAAHHYLYHYY